MPGNYRPLSERVRDRLAELEAQGVKPAAPPPQPKAPSAWLMRQLKKMDRPTLARGRKQ